MKYIVSAENFLWGEQCEELKTYSDDVIFIRYTMSQSQDRQAGYGKELVCEIQPMLGMDENAGIKSRKFNSLLKQKDELLTMISDDSVTVISDMVAESLYPYRLLLDADQFIGGLHLIGAIPFRFMGVRRKNNYKDLIWDTGRTNSAAVFDADRYLEGIENRQITLPEVLRNISSLLLKPISAVSELSIQNMEAGSIYYYDFALEKYSLIDREEYPYYPHGKEILAGIGPAPSRKDGNATTPARCSKLTIPEWLRVSEKDENAATSVPPPTPTGKELCSELKAARIQLAEENGIPFESPDCPSETECGGTCEACDEELRYLNQEMEKIPEDQRKYPKIL